MSRLDTGAGAPVRVLFIAGNGRSGSTVLHNVLGQLDGFTAVGELRYVWQRGVLDDWLCGCGETFGTCPFWRDVLDVAFGGVSRERAEQLAARTEEFRIKHLVGAPVPALRRRRLSRVGDLMDALGELYGAIASVGDGRVIVDSSKNPSFGYLVAQLPGVDVRFLHLVRDAPPVAWSWGREKEFQPGIRMPRKSPVRAALQWDARNAMTEAFLARGDRAMRMRFEDFLVDPRTAVADVASFAGEPDVALPFRSTHDVVLEHPNHSVFGNEVRFAKGAVTLRGDDRWRTQLAAADRRKVAALTWPLRMRYGYLGRGRTARTPGQEVAA